MKAKEMKGLRKKIEKADRVEDSLKSLKGRIYGHYSLQQCTTTTPTPTPTPFYHLESSATTTTDASSWMKIQSFPSWQKIEPSHLFRDMMELFLQNMGELYQSSSWGLSMDDKQQELRHRKARFLVVTTKGEEGDDQVLVAFCHYRYEYDDDEYPTCGALYVYEIQVSPRFQSQGIGNCLMLLLEDLARQTGMSKTMLTVFHSNTLAMTFYKHKLQYEIDESNDPHNREYSILSKSILVPGGQPVSNE